MHQPKRLNFFEGARYRLLYQRSVDWFGALERGGSVTDIDTAYGHRNSGDGVGDGPLHLFGNTSKDSERLDLELEHKRIRRCMSVLSELYDNYQFVL